MSFKISAACFTVFSSLLGTISSKSCYSIRRLTSAEHVALAAPAPDVTIFDVYADQSPDPTPTATRTIYGIAAQEIGSTDDETTYVVNGVWTTTVGLGPGTSTAKTVTVSGMCFTLDPRYLLTGRLRIIHTDDTLIVSASGWRRPGDKDSKQDCKLHDDGTGSCHDVWSSSVYDYDGNLDPTVDYTGAAMPAVITEAAGDSDDGPFGDGDDGANGAFRVRVDVWVAVLGGISVGASILF